MPPFPLLCKFLMPRRRAAALPRIKIREAVLASRILISVNVKIF